MRIGRRSFIASAAAFASAPAISSGSAPALRFGIASDIHLTDAASAVRWERALAYFASRKADAVLVCGDLADHGLVSQLKLVGDAWRKVFPRDRRPDGGRVEKLLHYGDHDTALNARARRVFVKEKGLEGEFIPNLDRGKVWTETFDEPWAPIMRKTVRGFDFILANFTRGPAKTNPSGDNTPGLAEFLEKAKLPAGRPFFFSQHRIFRGTAGREIDARGQDDGKSTEILSRYPGAIAFCGHGHVSSRHEECLWRGAFTAVEVPSLFYQIVHWLPKVKTDYAPEALFAEASETELVLERLDGTSFKPLAAPWRVPFRV